MGRVNQEFDSRASDYASDAQKQIKGQLLRDDWERNLPDDNFWERNLHDVNFPDPTSPKPKDR
jgi:hypothetical protein